MLKINFCSLKIGILSSKINQTYKSKLYIEKVFFTLKKPYNNCNFPAVIASAKHHSSKNGIFSPKSAFLMPKFNCLPEKTMTWLLSGDCIANLK